MTIRLIIMMMTHRRARGLDLLLFYPLGFSCEQGVRLPKSMDEKPSFALLSRQRTSATTTASKTPVVSEVRIFSPCFQRHGYRYVRPKYKTSTMPKTTVTMHAMTSLSFPPVSSAAMWYDQKVRMSFPRVFLWAG